MFFHPKQAARKRLQLRISERRFLLMLGDVLATIIAVLLSLLIWTLVDKRRPFDFPFIVEQIYWFFILPGLWLLLASANDFYDLQLASRFGAAISRLILITLQLFVVYLIIFFLSPREELPRLFIVYYALSSLLLIGFWRLIRPAVMDWATESRHLLVVGGGWGAEAIIQAIQERAAQQYSIIGLVGAPEQVGSAIAGLPVLGSGRDLWQIADRHEVFELVDATTGDLSAEMFQGLMDCYQHGLSIIPMPILYERLTGRVPVEHVGKDWAIILPLETTSIFNPYSIIKRLADIAVALLGIVLFVCILPPLALVMMIDSPGPVFFRQVRLGRGGAPFKVIKLRTMVPNAEKFTGAVFAGKDDPRITRVGRFLRKSRLDEVPQFFNVLRGEMSLIGPRPERPEFIEELTTNIPFYRARLAVKPGVTGWAQVRHIYVSSMGDHLIKLQYDLYYIRHQSLLLDAQIAIRTIGKMLSLRGT